MKAYYVYILASKRNGTLYVGVSSDLPRRIYEHKRKLIDGFTWVLFASYLNFYIWQYN